GNNVGPNRMGRVAEVEVLASEKCCPEPSLGRVQPSATSTHDNDDRRSSPVRPSCPEAGRHWLQPSPPALVCLSGSTLLIIGCGVQTAWQYRVVVDQHPDRGKVVRPRDPAFVAGRMAGCSSFARRRSYSTASARQPYETANGPAAILPARAAQHIAAILAANATPDAVIDEESRHMRDYRVATTANRSVVGIMNEFSRLAGVHRDHAERTAHRPSSGAA